MTTTNRSAQSNDDHSDERVASIERRRAMAMRPRRVDSGFDVVYSRAVKASRIGRGIRPRSLTV
jgi:hypothetical protein